ncbi:hypothetical protein Pla52n_04660 [Stieleria varia]|uniref:Uncharacterized protein n=1 Tax=Stieleria varia TaxID=2528005 RepID=A0A5C6B7H6_9BACT|nr:hypothetical protein Pla52n_04660 [Stieleria varia]
MVSFTGCDSLFTVYVRWILCFRRACPGSEQQLAATVNTIAFTSPPPANRQRRFAGGGEFLLACAISRQMFPPPRQARRKELLFRKRRTGFYSNLLDHGLARSGAYDHQAQATLLAVDG